MKGILIFLFFYTLIEFSFGITQRPRNPSVPSSRRPPSRPSPTPASQPKPNIKTLGVLELPGSEYPNYLTNEDGMALYTDSTAEIGESSCYGDCAKIFTPAIIKFNDSLGLGDQLNEDKVGFVKRRDGSQQVAYNKYSLFYFKNDTDRGDTKGQGYNNTWFLIDMRGILYSPNRTDSRNETDRHGNETVRAEEPSIPSQPSAGRPSQILTVPGYSSILLVPDEYLIHFTLNERDDNQSFINVYNNLNRNVKDLKSIIDRVGTTDLTFLAKNMGIINGTNNLSYSYFTTTTDPDKIDRLASAIAGLNSQNRTVLMTIGTTLSNSTINNTKKSLFQASMKNSLDSAFEMAGNLNRTINPKRPIYSIKIDPDFPKNLNPFYFTDTSRSQLLMKKDQSTPSVAAMKILVDYVLK